MQPLEKIQELDRENAGRQHGDWGGFDVCGAEQWRALALRSCC